MTFSRRTLSILTILVVLGLLGGGVWWRLKPAADDPSEAEASETEQAEGVTVGSATSQFSTDIPQAVEGAEVIQDTLWISVTASGQAVAFREAVIQPQVPGLVTALPVRENSAVSAGQAVLQIDTTELAMDLAEAQSQLLTAQADYEIRIFQGGDIADPEQRDRRETYARIESGLNTAELNVRRALMDLERSTVRAPFEGRIANVQVVPGTNVATGTELMTVVDVNPIKFDAKVLEAQLGLLREGRRATVQFAAFPGETFTGTVSTINPMVDEDRTGRVTILLNNADGRIKPGYYGDARMEAQSFPNRIIVPRAALLERGQDQGTPRDMLFVYNPEKEVADWRYVNPGRENDTQVELLPPEEGPEDGWVEPGEIVLTNGHHYLAHDTKVRLVESVTAAGGRPGG